MEESWTLVLLFGGLGQWNAVTLPGYSSYAACEKIGEGALGTKGVTDAKIACIGWRAYQVL